jgi:hypothetical protein
MLLRIPKRLRRAMSRTAVCNGADAARISSAGLAAGSARPIEGRTLDFVLFLALLVVLIVKALADLDVGWDNLAYHLPFAALRSGIFGSEFSYGPYLTAAYDGFPPLQDVLKGYLWKLTGNINSTNLLTVFVFAFYVFILHHVTRAPLVVIACALAAIPTIHVQLASGHVDNLANLALALALVVTFVATTQSRRDPFLLYCLAVAGLGFAANVKLHFVVLSSLALVLVSVLFWAKYVRYQGRGISSRHLAVLVVGSLAIAWLPLRGIILYGNPLYPIELSVFGYQLPGTIHMADYGNPAYLKDYPQFLKWLLSVTEYHAFDYRIVPYTIAQGDTPASAMSFRMGGYLFVYVFVSLVLFVFLALHQPRAIGLGILAAALAVTILVAILPASHELRYFSFWMVALVSCVLCMLWAGPDYGQLRFAYATLCIGCFWFVASITGYASLMPQGYSMDWVTQQIRFDEKFRPRIHPNQTYCLVDFGPYGIVAAPAFHPELGPYSIHIAGLDGCGDATVLKLDCDPPRYPCN